MNIYYEVIGGSRSYGLEIERSDIDLLRAANGKGGHGIFEDKYNIIQETIEKFENSILYEKQNAFWLQWLFPKEVHTNNELTQFLQSNREKIIIARKPMVYSQLMTHANGLAMYPDKLFTQFPKRLAYAILFYKMAGDYAEGSTFAEAHHASYLQESLLAIRRSKLPFEEVMELLEKYRYRAEQAAGFYDVPIDETFLEEVKHQFELCRLGSRQS